MLRVVESTGEREGIFPEVWKEKNQEFLQKSQLGIALIPSATPRECWHRESRRGSKDLTRQEEERPQGGAGNLERA